MAERLGIVAEVGAAGRFHLFGVQAEWCREVDERRETGRGVGGSSGFGECLYEPERAGHERAFRARQAGPPGWVAVEQGPAGVEVSPDRIDRALDARPVARFDAEER